MTSFKRLHVTKSHSHALHGAPLPSCAFWVSLSSIPCPPPPLPAPFRTQPLNFSLGFCVQPSGPLTPPPQLITSRGSSSMTSSDYLSDPDTLIPFCCSVVLFSLSLLPHFSMSLNLSRPFLFFLSNFLSTFRSIHLIGAFWLRYTRQTVLLPVTVTQSYSWFWDIYAAHFSRARAMYFPTFAFLNQQPSFFNYFIRCFIQVYDFLLASTQMLVGEKHTIISPMHLHRHTHTHTVWTLITHPLGPSAASHKRRPHYIQYTGLSP